MNPKRIIPGQSDQCVLFSTNYIGDRLSRDHEVFEFQKLIKRMDLSSLIEAYGDEGGRMYSPRDLFAIVCYGYHKSLPSAYKMAEAVASRLDFIYLAGGHQIKRRTISEFRRRQGKVLEDLLNKSVKLADEVGLIDREKIFAGDGTKIRANANRDQRKERDEWEAIQNKLIKSVGDFLSEWEKNDQLEDDIEKERAEKIRQIRERINNLPQEKSRPSKDNPSKNNIAPRKRPEKEPRKEDDSLFKIQSIKDAERALDKADKIIKTLEETSANSINLTDLDSRLMKYGKNAHESYNAQIISNNGLIVAATVSTSENDQNQLEPIVELMLKNVPLKEGQNIFFAADAGYNRGKNLAWLETKPEIDAYISMHRRKKNKNENEYSKDKFIFDEQENEYTCPRGKVLEHTRDLTQKGQKRSLYGAKIENCIFCTGKNQCVTGDDIKRGYRTIEDDEYAIFRNAMRAKMKLEESKQIYRKRSGEVEPRFGNFKTRGLRYLRLRRLSGAKTEFLFATIGSNLARILKLSRQSPQLA